MTRDIVYGTKGDKPGYGQFVELFMFDEDNHLGIDWTNNGHAEVYHFLIKDKEDYEDFKGEITAVLKDCKDINSAHYALEVYLDSDYAGDFLDEYPDWKHEYPDWKPERRTKDEIYEYMEEAYDRVWLMRKQGDLVCNLNLINGIENIDLDILGGTGMLNGVKEVCDKYKIDFSEPVSDWDYGYWSGILAALRWVMGDEKDMLDT